jgi:hypothetical protein
VPADADCVQPDDPAGKAHSAHWTADRGERAGPGVGTVAFRRILKADITAPQQWNVDAEHRFRTWAVEYFSAKPVEAELSTRRELVSQWERTEHPELEGGFHANLLWGGVRLWNTGGYIGWDDLMHIPEIRDKYSADVTNGPHIQAIRSAIKELSIHIDEMMEEHQKPQRRERRARHRPACQRVARWPQRDQADDPAPSGAGESRRRRASTSCRRGQERAG